MSSAFDRPDQGAVVHEARRAGHDVEEDRVEVLAAQPGGARRRVHLEDLHAALVPALDHHDRGGVRPPDGNQVLETGPVPLDLPAGSVQAHQPQRDIGVGRSGSRIGNLPWRPVGVRRIGDVPAGDGRGVDPGHEQGVTAR